VGRNDTPENGEPEVSLDVIAPKVPAAVGSGTEEAAPAQLEPGHDGDQVEGEKSE
jgi:hypothetical protein